MRVHVRKRPDGGSVATIERDDGVVLRLRSYDRTGEVPHDAVHLVGEQELGIQDGLWGSLAAGAVFDSVEVVDGRQRHDWRRRSDEVRRRNADRLALAETVVGVLQHAIDLDGAQVKKALDAAWGVTRPGPSPFTAEQGAAAVARIRELRTRWRDLDGDAALSFEWGSGAGDGTRRRRRR
jgi:hypothetical protein